MTHLTVPTLTLSDFFLIFLKKKKGSWWFSHYSWTHKVLQYFTQFSAFYAKGIIHSGKLTLKMWIKRGSKCHNFMLWQNTAVIVKHHNSYSVFIFFIVMVSMIFMCWVNHQDLWEQFRTHSVYLKNIWTKNKKWDVSLLWAIRKDKSFLFFVSESVLQWHDMPIAMTI